jgi:hypothetical protein
VPTTLHHRVAGAAAGLFIALVAVLAGAATASAETVAFRAYAKEGAVYYFNVQGVAPRRVKYATVTVFGERWRVGKRRLRRGVRNSTVRAHTPPRVHQRLMNHVSAAASQPFAAKLRIKVRRHRSRGNNPTTGTPTTGNPGVSNPAGNGNAGNPDPGSTSSHNAACGAGVGSFGPGAWPSACWRPYSDDSPFNRKLPSSPRLAGNSDQVIERMTGFGPPEHILAGVKGANDFSKPVYWSQPSDPVYKLHCSYSQWGRCAIEGDEVHVPDSARSAGGSDGHITIVDQTTGWEYDMWGVTRKSGGVLVANWGGKTRIDGDGLGSAAVAAGYGTMAGKIRVEELEAGKIDHALFISVNCDSGKYVYPAIQGGRSCSSIGESDNNAPSMGMRIQLDMSSAQIDNLDVPSWKKTILHAMADYGMYIGDTGNSWAIAIEGGTGYTSLGYDDPWVKFAKKNNVPYYAPDDDYVFNIRDGVDWKRHLRVVDPCEAKGSCS